MAEIPLGGELVLAQVDRMASRSCRRSDGGATEPVMAAGAPAAMSMTCVTVSRSLLARTAHDR